MQPRHLFRSFRVFRGHLDYIRACPESRNTGFQPVRPAGFQPAPTLTPQAGCPLAAQPRMAVFRWHGLSGYALSGSLIAVSLPTPAGKCAASSRNRAGWGLMLSGSGRVRGTVQSVACSGGRPSRESSCYPLSSASLSISSARAHPQLNLPQLPPWDLLRA